MDYRPSKKFGIPKGLEFPNYVYQRAGCLSSSSQDILTLQFYKFV